MLGGGGLTNEKAYLLGKFARVALRTSNIDYNGRFCMSSAAAAGLQAYGIDRGLPFPVEDIPGAAVILLAGGNLAETMPPMMQYFNEQQRRGRHLIVLDPRATATARSANLHLQLTPGTDAAVANGLLHIAVAEGFIDHDFVAARTTGYEPVRRIVASYWPERVERISGVPVAQLYEAARLLGRASTAMILTARGPEQQRRSVDNVLAFINLALALGKAGKPYCGYGCLPARATDRVVASTVRRRINSRVIAESTTRPIAHTSPASGALTRSRCRGRAVPPTNYSTLSAPKAACVPCC